MTAGPVRRGLHALHAVAGLALVVTGLLILLPDLRSSTLGGYGREVGLVHVYLGLLFAVAPVLAWMWVPRGLLAGSWERIRQQGPGATWRRAHIVVTLVASAALSLSGVIMWLGTDLPTAIWDATDQVHVVCHWVVTLSLPVHLLVSRRRIAERVRLALGSEPPDPFEFGDELDEEP